MNWPTSQDYNEAVQDPTSFSDPDLRGGQVAVNAMGLPIPRSGNFADVYQYTGAGGKVWALKCFTRKVDGLQERYTRIDGHLGKARLPFAVGFQFQPAGIRVRGEWFGLLKMEWVEGFTLNDFVSRNLDKPHLLHALMQMWAKLAARLRDANLAHADLQHGNVLLVPGATPQTLGLKLIDYDGMWVPALAEHPSGELGHPNFQHPFRLKDHLYNGDVDRFPHLVIAAGLRAALVGGRAVWDRFDNGDNLLFKEADLRDPAAAVVFKALWNLNDPVLRTLVGHIALAAGQPLRKTPWLDDVLLETGGPRLSADQERQVCDLLGVAAAAPKGVASDPPAGVEREFNVFEFLDDDVAPKAAGPAASGRHPAPKRMPVAKSKTQSKAPVWIGGGVAAVLVAGVAIALAVNGGKKGTPPEVVLNKDVGKKGPEAPPNKDKAGVKKEAGGPAVNPKPPEVKVAPPILPVGLPADEWLERVKGLPPDTLAKATGERLRECNPGFDGKVDYRSDGEKIVWLGFSSVLVKDLSAVRALPDLQELHCTGHWWGRNGQIADLTPLRGMNLKILGLNDTQVADLSPLTGMPLEILACGNTNVSDLSPLRGMPLKSLILWVTKVSDLVPLKGMQLTDLNIYDTPVTDDNLTAIEGMSSLRVLVMGTPNSPTITATALVHLKKLTGLEKLQFGPFKMNADGVGQLEAMTNLKELTVSGLTDDMLAHLKDLVGLKVLSLGGSPVTDAGLNHLSALKELTSLNLENTRMTDAGVARVSAFEKLTFLSMAGAPLTDAGLAPLSTLDQLTFLNLANTRVTDAGLARLAALKRLTVLQLYKTPVTDAGVAKFKKARPECKVER